MSTANPIPPSAGPPTASPPAPVLQQVLAQAGMELRLLVRSGESVLISFGIPLGILVFAVAVVPVSLGDGEPVQTLVPAVLALAALSTAFTAQAIQTGFQRKYAVLKRLGATPLTRPAFLVAKALAVSALVAVQSLLVLGVGVLLGWRWPTGASVTLLVVGLLVGTAAFTALGLLLAGTLKAEVTLALANALYLVLAALGGLALRTGEADLVTQVAAATPAGALARLLTDALPPAVASTADPAAWTWPLGALIVWLVVAVAAAARWFRWEP